jgi:glycosyltransferase involved in cell wall biosynthesis
MNYKVSIIIPLHNAEDYIIDTLESCFAQTYQNIEVIVVENGSDDTSLLAAKSIEDQRLQVFEIGPSSASAARNYGFEKSIGSFVLFLDADDFLATNLIETQLNLLLKKPEGWIASCAWAKFKDSVENSEIISQTVWEVSDPVEWCLQSWMGGGMMIPACWLIPRQIIKKAGPWDESVNLHDDGEFMCRVLLASKGNLFVNETVVYYRQVSNSLSRKNKSLSAAKSTLNVYKSYEESIFRVVNNARVRHALAYNYCRFLYEFHPNFPILLEEAQHRLERLGTKDLILVGGDNFTRLTKIIGFKNALKFRNISNHIRIFFRVS